MGRVLVKRLHSPDSLFRTRTYRSWEAMLGRCRNPNNAAFHNYGGRGITVCDEWTNFAAFLQDMGTCPRGLVLDRIDNNGAYCKENCRWTSRAISGQNTRSVILTMEKAREIRSLYGTGAYTMKSLGGRFGVTAQTVCYVVNSKQWIE